MKYAVLGCGRQGIAVIADLLDYCQADRIVAFDTDAGVTARLREVLGERAARVELHALSPADPAAAHRVVELIAGSACAISALPYALNPDATRLCLRAAVPMCDLGGNPDVVAQQMAICGENGLIVPDCGLAPGLNNILAVYLRQRFAVTAMRAYCGGIPAERDPANPLQYKLLFSPWGLVSEYSGRCAVLHNRRVEFVEALTGLEPLPNEREAFFTSNNAPLSFEQLAGLGVREYAYKTVRWRGHLERVLLLKSLGFFRGNRALDQALVEGMSQQPWLAFDRTRDVDEVVLWLEGESDDGSRHRAGITVRGDRRLTAMEKTTSWGATIPAYWIARAAGANLPRGCLPPQQVVDAAWAVEELKRRTPVET